MAQGTYTRSDLKTALNSRTHGRNSGLQDIDALLNAAVREVLAEIDLRGSKRKKVISPNLFDDVYSYVLPSDVKGLKIIDIVPQVGRIKSTEWELVTEEEFDRKKQSKDNLVALADNELRRVLRISKDVDDDAVTLANFESLNADGDTWLGYGSVNDSDIKADRVNYIKGSAALRFQDNGDTTSTAFGLQGKITSADLSSYLSGGSVLAWARLTDADSDIKQITLRLGSDSANYYEISETEDNEGNSFQTGWNLIRFDLADRTKTGSPTDTGIDYVALFWTKNAGTHLTDSDNAFDYLVARSGEIFYLLYYSKYLWQTAGTASYKENSTADTDTLSVDTEEFELIVLKAAILAAQELRDYDDFDRFIALYERKKREYVLQYPSEALTLVSQTYEFSTLGE